MAEPIESDTKRPLNHGQAWLWRAAQLSVLVAALPHFGDLVRNLLKAKDPRSGLKSANLDRFRSVRETRTP